MTKEEEQKQIDGIVPVKHEVIEPVNQEYLPPPESITEKRYALLSIRLMQELKRTDKEKQEVEGELELTKAELEQVKMDRDIEHQDYISNLNESRRLANEANGLLKREMSVNERAEANHLSLLASVNKVEDAMKPANKGFNFKMSWQIAVLIGFFLFVWQIGYNPNFRQALSDNMPVVIIVSCVIAFIAFMSYRDKRKKK